MKTLTTIFLLLFLSNFIFAQEIHYFNKAITHPDSLNYSLSGFEVEDGFVILNYNLPRQGSRIHLELLKLNPLGNLQWKKRLGEVAFFPPINAMVRDKENPNHFLVSYVEKNDTNNFAYTVLLKCTEEGIILWKKEYPNPNHITRPHRLIHTNNNGYLIAGAEGYRNTGSMLAIKVDSIGNQEWYETYPMDTVSYGLFGSQTLDGGYILSGHADSHTNYNIYVVKIDNDGKKEWHKVIDVDDNDTSPQAVQLSDGNYLVTATADVGWNTQHYTAILDADGEFIRERSQIIRCLHTIQTPLLSLDNDEFLAGAMRCDANIDNYFSPYLMRFNSMGDTLWTKQFTPSNIIADNVYPRDIKKTSDGGYLMTGYADHTLGPDAIPYGWIVKMDSLGNTCWELGCDSTVIISGIEESVHRETALNMHPNPTKSLIQIQLNAPFPPHSLQIQLTNMEGRVVKKAWVEDGSQLDVSDLESGIYIAVWLQEGAALKQEKMVILK